MDDANRQLVQHEKLASIGRMAATIATRPQPSDLGELNIEKIAEEESFAETVKAHIGRSSRASTRSTVYQGAPLISPPSGAQLERWRIEQIVDGNRQAPQETLARRRSSWKNLRCPMCRPSSSTADKMRQVFLNVLRNAHEALESGGKTSIACDPVEEGGRTMVREGVADNGPGIPEKDRPNIFEPFYSTKPSGFGLGLANARKIVEQHSGTIRSARSGARQRVRDPHPGGGDVMKSILSSTTTRSSGRPWPPSWPRRASTSPRPNGEGGVTAFDDPRRTSCSSTSASPTSTGWRSCGGSGSATAGPSSWS